MTIIPIMAAASGTATSSPMPGDDERRWHEIGASDKVFETQDCHGTTLEGVRIGLFRVEGAIFALDDICTHGAALLSDGFLEGHEVECPLHAGLVDVRTGKPCSSPITRATRCHDVRVENGRIFVRMNP